MEKKNISFDPAFPIVENNGLQQTVWYGLSRREYFAAMVMQGMLANIIPQDGNPEGIATFSIACADELLKQLENNK